MDEVNPAYQAILGIARCAQGLVPHKVGQRQAARVLGVARPWDNGAVVGIAAERIGRRHIGDLAGIVRDGSGHCRAGIEMVQPELGFLHEIQQQRDRPAIDPGSPQLQIHLEIIWHVGMKCGFGEGGTGLAKFTALHVLGDHAEPKPSGEDNGRRAGVAHDGRDKDIDVIGIDERRQPAALVDIDG